LLVPVRYVTLAAHGLAVSGWKQQQKKRAPVPLDVRDGIAFTERVLSGRLTQDGCNRMTPLLDVQDLSIGFGAGKDVVDDVSFRVHAGETLALVGESGSGKTITCRAILRILPGTAQIRGGAIRFAPGSKPAQELLQLSERGMRRIRGNRISMIFQEPMRSLSPLHRLGDQVSEVLRVHRDTPMSRAKSAVLETFERVGFPDPLRVWRSYPFELSGGMRQRAMIAMAIVAKPDLLIADEPTTALDVTTQAQVLGLIKDVQRDIGMAVVLVTHDLGVVANMAETIVVMNKGRVMERGPAHAVLSTPAHGYTKKLIAAAPMIPEVAAPARQTVPSDLILELRNVSKTFTMRAGGWRKPVIIPACQQVSLSLPRGKTLAIVGESGSGKTTCARIALGADLPDPGGEVLFRGTPDGDTIEVHAMTPGERKAFQREAQMVFQDPYSSLSPRMRILQTMIEPMEIHGIGTRSERRERAAEMLRRVGLDPSMLSRYPHAFSGGQRQRLSIARALTLDPELLVCDEPTSALDVSVQDQILNLLEDIRDSIGLSYLFISHDLAVVARIADEVAVMRQGVVVEQAAPDTLFYNPQHPYTRALIAAQPEPDIGRPINLDTVARGAGAPTSWPEMFRFEGDAAPALREIEPGHKVRCHA
jgi:peptide/nickel transport system ATP-binding protein